MAVTWTTQRTGNWSLISSNASSPWYDGGTQTGYARTPGSSSNSNNDLVIIANGHTLTCDASVTVGDTVTTTNNAISNAASGTGILSVSTGVTLTVVSNCINRGTATWTWAAGSGLTFGNASTVLTWTTSESTKECKLVFNGSSGSHCTVTSTTAGKGKFTYAGGSSTTASNIDASYTDFSNLGDSSTTAMLLYGGSSTTHLHRFANCTFTTCGDITFNNCSASGTMSFDTCTWTSAPSTRNLIPVATQARTSGTRLITNCSFDKLVGNSSSFLGWTIRGSLFPSDFSNLASADLRWDEFSGNFWWSSAGGRYITGPTSSANAWNYALFHNTSAQIANLHAFNHPLYLTGTVEVSGWVMEPGNTDTAGDLYGISTSTASNTLTIKNWLVLPNSSGLKAGKFISCLGPLSPNLTLKVEHCTVVSDGSGETGVVQYGENLKPFAGTIATCKSNLCWSYTTNNGMLVQVAGSSPSGTCNVSGTAVTGTSTKWSTGSNDGNAANISISVGDYIRFGSDTTAYLVDAVNSDTSLTLHSSAGTKTGVSWNVLVKDVITAADYNGKWNMATGTDGVGYNSNANYSWFQSFSSAPGTHDVTLSSSPFVDSTRGIATWAVYKALARTAGDGGGTVVAGDSYNIKVRAAVAYIAVSPSTRIAEMVDWIKDGWKVTASTLNNAGHDSVTIGALGYVSVGNPAYLSAWQSGGMFTGG